MDPSSRQNIRGIFSLLFMDLGTGRGEPVTKSCACPLTKRAAKHAAITKILRPDLLLPMERYGGARSELPLRKTEACSSAKMETTPSGGFGMPVNDHQY